MSGRLKSNKALLLAIAGMMMVGALALPSGARESLSGRALTDHAPIAIDGNAQLTAANGVSGGDGSKGNPFIIENFRINSSQAAGDKVCIDIRNTTQYVTIRGCELTGDPADEDNSSYGVRTFGGLNLTVEGCTMYYVTYGVMGYSSDDTISGNEIYNTRYAISMGGFSMIGFKAENNVIAGNTIHHNKGGMILSYCEDCVIENNTLYDHNVAGGEQIGVLVQLAERTIVRGNNITRSEGALHLQYSNDSEIYHNDLWENEYVGAVLLYSYHNLLYENNFIGNVQHQALDYNGTNVWNTTEKGNYWSDYNGTDANSDGIGDTPRGIPMSQTEFSGYDYKPLMAPWGGGAPPANMKPIAQILAIAPNPADQGTEVTFNGTGSDADGTVTAYKWASSIDGFLSGQKDFTCSSLSAGTHDITFEVQDDDGAWSDPQHQTLAITVPSANQKPGASVSSPAANSTVKGNVTISGTADDSDGSVQGVQVKVDDGNWTNATLGRSTVSWSFVWDTSKVADGKHMIKVRSFDGTEYSNETQIEVTVNNTVAPPNLPPAAVALSFSELTNRSAKLVWTKSTEADFHMYQLMSSTDNSTFTLVLNITDSANTTYIAMNLAPNTTRYYLVRVSDTGGLSNDSNRVKVTTLPDGPLPPTNKAPTVSLLKASKTRITAGGSTTFTVTANDTDGTVTSYWFDFGDGTNSSWSASATATHKYSKTGTYTIKAKVRDNNGTESNWSSTVTLKVEKKAEPTPPVGALGLAAAIAAGALVLGWRRKR